MDKRYFNYQAVFSNGATLAIARSSREYSHAYLARGRPKGETRELVFKGWATRRELAEKALHADVVWMTKHGGFEVIFQEVVKVKKREISH